MIFSLSSCLTGQLVAGDVVGLFRRIPSVARLIASYWATLSEHFAFLDSKCQALYGYSFTTAPFSDFGARIMIIPLTNQYAPKIPTP